jgi:hypothetical protein
MGSSRAVEVILDWDDTYTVSRNRMITKGKNAGTVVTEKSSSGIYCDQLSEIVWDASCWK